MIIETKDDFEKFLSNVAFECIQHNKCSMQCPLYDYCDGEFVSISLKSIKRICQNNDEVNEDAGSKTN